MEERIQYLFYKYKSNQTNEIRFQGHTFIIMLVIYHGEDSRG